MIAPGSFLPTALSLDEDPLGFIKSPCPEGLCFTNDQVWRSMAIVSVFCSPGNKIDLRIYAINLEVHGRGKSHRRRKPDPENPWIKRSVKRALLGASPIVRDREGTDHAIVPIFITRLEGSLGETIPIQASLTRERIIRRSQTMPVRRVTVRAFRF